ncbi:MAG: hypothetical protein K9M57_01075 [Phycisphaerae bacterium]|nr:hypothetical protein [Phycisphaerae bacterium]
MGKSRYNKDEYRRYLIQLTNVPFSNRERLRYFVDGVVLGSKEFVRDYLEKLKKEGYYLRRKKPISQLPGHYTTLREQRSHAVRFCGGRKAAVFLQITVNKIPLTMQNGIVELLTLFERMPCELPGNSE